MSLNMSLLLTQYGSVTATAGTRVDMTLDQFIDRLQHPIVVTCTMDEYATMSPTEKMTIKDHGAYIAGAVSGTGRTADHVTSRSMILLDVDHPNKIFLDRVMNSTKYCAIVHSTCGSTPDSPRYQVAFPMSRSATPDEFPAIVRYLAQDLGINQIDLCSFKINQAMLWPVCLSDATYICVQNNADILDLDAFLAEHPNWRDIMSLPGVSASCDAIAAKKLGTDPASKAGYIGAFCRAYTISSAIETFLTDVYTKVTDGRYKLNSSECLSGLVAFDDKYAYSFHASDPVALRLVTAFDLVRINKFGDDDFQISTRQMIAMIKDDKAVKRALQHLDNISTEIAPSDSNGINPKKTEAWRAEFEYDDKGTIKQNQRNVQKVYDNDPNLGAIYYNEFTDRITVDGVLPWKQLKSGWNDSDLSQLIVYFGVTYGLSSPTKIQDGLTEYISKRCRHPVRDYLNGLPEWDGVERVDTLFIDYLGGVNTDYTRAVTRKTMAAAVARVFDPGCKFDSMLILVGNQGIGKSTILRMLAGNWFSDSVKLTDMSDKTAAEQLRGYWIVEMGELAGMRKAESETVKSFLSRQDDAYRPAYGRITESHPRQSILIGTTNATDGFLRDVTGNRRFWPVNVTGHGRLTLTELTDEVRDQIWAEALYRYRQGEPLYLTGEEAASALRIQSDAMETDERTGMVEQYLEMPITDDWDDLSLTRRREYIAQYRENGECSGSVRRLVVTNMEIFAEAYGNEPSRLTKTDSYEIAAIMAKISGWTRDAGAMITTKFYGRQRCYRRKNPNGDNS